jgi:hypothetical protein
LIVGFALIVECNNPQYIHTKDHHPHHRSEKLKSKVIYENAKEEGVRLQRRTEWQNLYVRRTIMVLGMELMGDEFHIVRVCD